MLKSVECFHYRLDMAFYTTKLYNRIGLFFIYLYLVEVQYWNLHIELWDYVKKK